VRIPEGQIKRTPFDFGTITDAIDFKHTLKPVGHTFYHIGDKGTNEATIGSFLLSLLVALDQYLVISGFQTDPSNDRL
jgi:hypothetical protein